MSVVCASSNAADQATVLVCFGQRNRPVTFTREEGTSDLCSLEKAIRQVFKDLPSMQEGGSLILQVKHEDWGGMFIDLGHQDATADRSIIKASFDVIKEPMATSTPISSPQQQEASLETSSLSHASCSGIQMTLGVSGSTFHLMKHVEPEGGDMDPLSTTEQEDIIAAARIYIKPPITKYHMRVNEEAGRLAVANPALLTRRADLLKEAREAVHAGGYA